LHSPPEATMLDAIPTAPEDCYLDEYSSFAHEAVKAAEGMFPGSRAYAASGVLGCVHTSAMPVLVELPDGDVAVVRYSADA
jgi:hypothetical protein